MTNKEENKFFLGNTSFSSYQGMVDAKRLRNIEFLKKKGLFKICSGANHHYQSSGKLPSAEKEGGECITGGPSLSTAKKRGGEHENPSVSSAKEEEYDSDDSMMREELNRRKQAEKREQKEALLRKPTYSMRSLSSGMPLTVGKERGESIAGCTKRITATRRDGEYENSSDSSVEAEWTDTDYNIVRKELPSGRLLERRERLEALSVQRTKNRELSKKGDTNNNIYTSIWYGEDHAIELDEKSSDDDSTIKETEHTQRKNIKRKRRDVRCSKNVNMETSGSPKESSHTDRTDRRRTSSPDPFLHYQGGYFRRYKNNNKRERSYRCNQYFTSLHSEPQWTKYKHAKKLAKGGIPTRCSGLMNVPVYEGVKSIPYFIGEHLCGWNAPLLLRGEPSNRPTLELVQPSYDSRMLVLKQDRVELKEKLEQADIWEKITGGGRGKREYAQALYGNPDALSAVEKAMKPYIQLVQEKYKALTEVKLGALRTFPNEGSQYSRHQHKLHSDYTTDCKNLPPHLRPISVIVSIDAFQIMYLPTKFDKRGDIVRTTIFPGQMIMFTDDCLHSGGPNKTDKIVYRLFAYLASRRADIPLNGVSTYTFSQTENPDDAVITDVFNGAESEKLKQQSKGMAYVSRNSNRTVREPKRLINEGVQGHRRSARRKEG